MDESRFHKAEKKIEQKILSGNPLSQAEMKRLLSFFTKTLEANFSVNETMDRKVFRQFFHANFDLTDIVIVDRIFDFFNYDKDKEDSLNSRPTYVQRMYIFLYRK